MLVDRKNVLELFKCPRTGVQLRRENPTTLAADDNAGIKYHVLNDYPILVDFDQSILDRDETLSRAAQSVVRRRAYSGLLRLVKRVLSPTPELTVQNVHELCSLLKKSSTSPKVLFIGAGSIGHGMQPFYADASIQVIAFDIYASEHVQFVADAHHIPLPGDYFDGVVIQAVLEHVLEPQTVVAEIHRVLKADGLVYAETPFLQHVHEGPYDFTRFTDSGHRYLFKDFGLVRSGVISGAGTQLLWSIDYFFRGLFRSRTVGKLFKLAFFWIHYLDKLIPEQYAIDAASGIYFIGRKRHEPAVPGDIIAYYKGAQ